MPAPFNNYPETGGSEDYIGFTDIPPAEPQTVKSIPRPQTPSTPPPPVFTPQPTPANPLPRMVVVPLPPAPSPSPPPSLPPPVQAHVVPPSVVAPTEAPSIAPPISVSGGGRIKNQKPAPPIWINTLVHAFLWLVTIALILVGLYFLFRLIQVNFNLINTLGLLIPGGLLLAGVFFIGIGFVLRRSP